MASDLLNQIANFKTTLTQQYQSVAPFFGARVGLAGLYLLATTLFLAPAGVALAIVLLWLGFVANPPRRVWLTQPVVLIAALWIFYLSGHLMRAWLTGNASPYSTFLWMHLAAVVPCAHFIAGNQQRLLRLLGLAVCGLVLGMLLRLNWGPLLTDPASYWRARDGFGFAAIAFGLYSGLGLLGLILLARRQPRLIGWPRQAVRLLWWLSAVLLLQGLLLTQSRGSWLAMVLGLIVGLGLLWHRVSFRAQSQSRHWLPVLAVIVLVIALNSGLLIQRLSQEIDTARALLHTTELPAQVSSIGLRWQAQQIGVIVWRERPWFGWGPGTTRLLLEHSRQRAGFTNDGVRLQHLHNSALELLVQLGLVGLMLWLALLAALAHGVWQSRRKALVERDLAAFVLAALVMITVWSLFNFRMLNQDWRGCWVLLAGAMLALHPLSLRPPTRNKPPQRILLIRLSAIGDIAFASPLIAALRRTYPRAHLTWLAQPPLGDLVRHHPDLDEVIEWPYPRLRALARDYQFRQMWSTLRPALKALRLRRFDWVLDLQGLLKSAVVARLSGAPVRIGLGSREGSAWLMTEVIARGGDPQQISSEYRYFAEKLQLLTKPFAMQIVPSTEAQTRIAKRIATAGLSNGFFVLCPFTTRMQKHWIESRWAELAAYLEATYQQPIVLIGGPDDVAAAHRIVQSSAVPVHNWTGTTQLLEAVALLAHARAVIGVDTGMSHLALAQGRPTVLLFGSTCPYRQVSEAPARVLYHAFSCSPCRRRPSCAGRVDCLRAIEVTEVLAAVHSLLHDGS